MSEMVRLEAAEKYLLRALVAEAALADMEARALAAEATRDDYWQEVLRMRDTLTVERAATEVYADDVSRLTAELEAERAKVAAGEASDGYHTHRELYEYRMLYNAHAAEGWYAAGIPVVKSWRHSDGEECFGGGWFVVVATLPTGQVSNHYEADQWDLFDVPEVDLPPEYDGHSPAQAAARLRTALAEENDR